MVWPILAGAAAGGAAYGLTKLFGGKPEVKPYNPNEDKFKYKGTNEYSWQDKGDAMGARGAPTANYEKYGFKGADNNVDASRQTQNDAINEYKSLLADPSKSVAQQQLRAGNDANVANMMAAARSGAPSAAASGQRTALQQGMAAGAQTNQQAGMLRAQETQAAVAGLSQASTAQRAQDLQRLGLSAQQAQFQAQVELQQTGLNDKFAMGLYGLGQNASMAELNAGMGMENLKGQQQLGAQTAQAGYDQAQMGGMYNMLGSGMEAGAKMSDGRVKDEVPPDEVPYADEHWQRLQADELKYAGDELKGLGKLGPQADTALKRHWQDVAPPTPKLGEVGPGGSYKSVFHESDARDKRPAREYFVAGDEPENWRHSGAPPADWQDKFDRGKGSKDGVLGHVDFYGGRTWWQPEMGSATSPPPWSGSYDDRAQSAPAPAGPKEGSWEWYKQTHPSLQDSDERVKTPGAPRGPDLVDDFSKIPTRTWRYKPGFGGSEPQVSPYAQDFERVPATHNAVKERPGGVKTVDTSQLALTSAAGLGQLARRVQRIEEESGIQPAAFGGAHEVSRSRRADRPEEMKKNPRWREVERDNYSYRGPDTVEPNDWEAARDTLLEKGKQKTAIAHGHNYTPPKKPPPAKGGVVWEKSGPAPRESWQDQKEGYADDYYGTESVKESKRSAAAGEWFREVPRPPVYDNLREWTPDYYQSSDGRLDYRPKHNRFNNPRYTETLDDGSVRKADPKKAQTYHLDRLNSASGAAANARAEGDKAGERKAIRQVAKLLRGSDVHKQPDPEFVQGELLDNGVKVPLKVIKDALREEYDL